MTKNKLERLMLTRNRTEMLTLAEWGRTGCYSRWTSSPLCFVRRKNLTHTSWMQKRSIAHIKHWRFRRARCSDLERLKNWGMEPVGLPETIVPTERRMLFSWGWRESDSESEGNALIPGVEFLFLYSWPPWPLHEKQMLIMSYKRRNPGYSLALNPRSHRTRDQFNEMLNPRLFTLRASTF